MSRRNRRGLRPDRQRQSQASHAETSRRRAAVGGALEELNALGLGKAAAGGDGFADGFPTAALAALLRAKLAHRGFPRPIG
jgi:hypothetical protein